MAGGCDTLEAVFSGINLVADQHGYARVSLPDPRTLPGLDALLPDPDEIEELVTEQLADTALFAGLFRENAVRSLLMPANLVGSFAAGLPIWVLTGSKRDALNFSISVFADTASALIGLNLKIDGEQHLWSRRPAVFIFNHQSNVDLVIVARLLRRDITGVGKREIRDLPIVGRVFEAAGVVLIDRKDTAKAIEAMAPLVDAMRVEGKSVCLSPEGTRSVTDKLAPFKKGAFHLAMQAGVPIVPIVFRNVLDALPKGAAIVRPAMVEAVVLPPIDTSSWTLDTLETEIERIRHRYIEILDESGQDHVR